MMDRRVLSCRTIDEDPSAVSLPFAWTRWGERRGDRWGDGCCGVGWGEEKMPLTGSRPCSSRTPVSLRTRPVRRPCLPGSKKLMFSLKLLCRRDCRCGVCEVAGGPDMSSQVVIGECDKCAGRNNEDYAWSLGGLSLCFGRLQASDCL